MRYFLDSEFIDDGQTIDLISIGIVCEDGRELYLQSCAFDPGKASQWIQDNVLSHLLLCPHVRTGSQTSVYANLFAHGGEMGQCTFTRGENIIGAHTDCPWRTRMEMRNEVLHFFTPGYETEIWGWCAGYDFVAFCQLFGPMMALPLGWPHYIKDIQYVLDERGISDDRLPQQEDGAHNALADAKHIKRLWEYLHGH